MKLTNFDNPVMSSWFTIKGARLDSKPYLSGALEARVLLEKLRAEKLPLISLTKGYSGGIYNGPQFVRNYVESEEFGVPFLTSGTMLLADFSKVGLLRKKDAFSPKLSYLKIEEGMTLISCSGTIGRMVYAAPSMNNVWSSQDILKVVPDPDKILPGYLYAYLSSKFGVPQVIEGTYGAIIQHLEPSHIAGLPVPIAPKDIQENVHDLVVEAAALRVKASNLLRSSICKLEEKMQLPHLSYSNKKSGVTIVSSNSLVSRLDALFYSQYHESVLGPLLNLPQVNRTKVSAISSSVVELPRFKRIHVDASESGVPFFGTTALMWADPVPNFSVSNAKQYKVNDKMVLIPRSGQLGGIIGHVTMPYGRLLDGAVTEHAIRVITDDKIVAGYLFIALSSEYGRRQLKARAFGSSIPTLDVHMVQETIIPKPPDDVLKDIGNQGLRIYEYRSQAIEKEQNARNIVEQWIETKNVEVV